MGVDKAAAWRNRIVGHGEMRAGDFLANPLNWRVHPKYQQEALAGVLDEVGWVQTVIVNKRTGALIDGHLRVALALRHGEDTSVPYVEVDLDEDEERKILATLDPITGMATADEEKLTELLKQVKTTNEAILTLLKSLEGKEEKEFYTRNIKVPIYEPKGECPLVSELYDDTKTRALIEEIDRVEGITEEEKQFLRIAAQRHTVLHFARIAEYYAHAPAELQRLMENSALVIIDFDRAIELGYVQLTEDLLDMYKEDYPDEG